MGANLHDGVLGALLAWSHWTLLTGNLSLQLSELLSPRWTLRHELVLTRLLLSELHLPKVITGSHRSETLLLGKRGWHPLARRILGGL
jgi:hypothetical protein